MPPQSLPFVIKAKDAALMPRTSVFLAMACLAVLLAASVEPMLLSRGPSGRPGTALSLSPSLDKTGERVVFVSASNDLTNDDKVDCNDESRGLERSCNDIFLFDARTSALRLVSRNGQGHQGNSDSTHPLLSAQGLHVLFTSRSDNLVTNDANQRADLFQVELSSGAIERVNVNTAGQEADAASQGGSNGSQHCALWCGAASMSGDGRYVAFSSWSTNLAEGDRNLRPDVFVRDLAARTTLLVSVARNGSQGDDASYFLDERWTMSRDGRYVAFTSVASNLVDMPLPSCEAETSKWPLPVRRCAQVYLKDLVTGDIELVSKDNGRIGSSISYSPTISKDGDKVAYLTRAPELAGEESTATQIVLWTRSTGETKLVTQTHRGTAAGGESYGPVFSGNDIVFISQAADLVESDRNGAADAFLWNSTTGKVSIMLLAGGKQADKAIHSLASSLDGNALAFSTDATNIVPKDDNGKHDVFLLSLEQGQASRPAPIRGGDKISAPGVVELVFGGIAVMILVRPRR